MQSALPIVVKANGDQVPFSEEKLRQSLSRSGAAPDMIQTIIDEVTASLYDGISTKSIYQKAFNLLKVMSHPVAARYKLKNALMELGPSGYPFEKYVGELFRFRGFTVKVGTIVEGHCVNHEVDVLAESPEKKMMIECKFHNRTGVICDVKTPLYVYSRFRDIDKKWQAMQGYSNKQHEGMLVTNTRFSTDAIKYATCAGLNLLSWDFPKKSGLRDMIDIAGLHPLTCLTSLSKKEKQALLENRIVLCKEIADNPAVLNIAGIPVKKAEKVLGECSLLLHNNKKRNGIK